MAYLIYLVCHGSFWASVVENKHNAPNTNMSTHDALQKTGASIGRKSERRELTTKSKQHKIEGNFPHWIFFSLNETKYKNVRMKLDTMSFDHGIEFEFWNRILKSNSEIEFNCQWLLQLPMIASIAFDFDNPFFKITFDFECVITSAKRKWALLPPVTPEIKLSWM